MPAEKALVSIHDTLTNPPETDDPAMIHDSTSHHCLDRSTDRIPRYSLSIRRRSSCLARHYSFHGSLQWASEKPVTFISFAL